MDAFSEILNGIKLNGALFFNAEFSAPWGFAAPASWTLGPALAPGAPHLIIYHFVIDGRAAARTVEGQSVCLEPGDVVVLPRGDPHLFTSGVEWAETTQTEAVVQKGNES